MRLWILSDYHLEHGTLHPEAVVAAGIPDADLCLCAGDFHQGGRSIRELDRLIGPHMPVAVTLGNHEFYGGEYREVRAECRAAAAGSRVTVLDPGVLVLGDLRVIGATLWTDYDLRGRAQRETAMVQARHLLNDHNLIRHRNGDRTVSAWSPHHARKNHEDELSYIIDRLSAPFDGQTVVLTHHAPHPNSIHPRFLSPHLSAGNIGFASDLSRVIERFQPALWVHGHMHNGSDYRIGETRVVANPKGYVNGQGQPENPDFDPKFVVELM